MGSWIKILESRHETENALTSKLKLKTKVGTKIDVRITATVMTLVRQYYYKALLSNWTRGQHAGQEDSSKLVSNWARGQHAGLWSGGPQQAGVQSKNMPQQIKRNRTKLPLPGPPPQSSAPIQRSARFYSPKPFCPSSPCCGCSKIGSGCSPPASPLQPISINAASSCFQIWSSISRAADPRS